MDFLQEARRSTEYLYTTSADEEHCLYAIAFSLMALVERLDALTVPLKDGEKALQTFTYTQEN